MNHGVGRVSSPVSPTTHLEPSSELIGEPPSSLIQFADPGLDRRIAILAPGALDLACALMRRGYSDVTIARCCDRPHLVDADLVIIPQAGSTALLDRAVTCSRCLLAPLGVIAIRFQLGSSGWLVEHARRALLLHGFSTLRVRNASGETLMRAELPSRGERQCA